jgi:hypothetical protein
MPCKKFFSDGTEIGEISSDGSVNWNKYFEMTLAKQ